VGRQIRTAAAAAAVTARPRVPNAGAPRDADARYFRRRLAARPLL
jgi:hypothetical protein